MSVDSSLDDQSFKCPRHTQKRGSFSVHFVKPTNFLAKVANSEATGFIVSLLCVISSCASHGDD